MNNDIKKLINETKNKFLNMKHLQTEESVNQYKNVLAKKKKEIEKSIRLSQVNLANNSKDFKEFFKYFSNISKSKTKIGPLTKDGILAESDLEKAEILNSHFSSVFIEENLNHIPQYDLPPTKYISYPFKDFIISEEEAEYHINHLTDNKSPDPDEIHPIILKSAPQSFSHALTILYNRSLTFGEVPVDWKLAHITPVFKKGKQTDPSNYRPISLTSIVCKILEKIIREKMFHHLVTNKLISDSQHGFIKGKSCLTNLIEFFENIINWNDENNPIDCIYLDISRAFDTVAHRKLIMKLKKYGFGEKLITWIKNWLLNRKQRVILNGEKSNWRNVLSGTPQGTVLSTVLFLVYIDDADEVLKHLKVIISKFADDMK